MSEPTKAKPRHQRPLRQRDARPDRDAPRVRQGGGPRDPAPPPALTETMRIAKAMARAGLCSRRDAERWIAEGRVAVNGRVIASPALDVGPKDRIAVDGNPLPVAEPAQLWRYHKPKGLVTTHKDPEGRPTVFDNLPEDMPRVISVGRLDFNTEGLLLLTTDGALARHLELPATGWLRRYRVRAHGRVTQAALDTLKQGVTIEGVRYGPVEALLEREQGANVWLVIGLREGKNREIRKIMSHLGLTVNRLIRVSYGPFQLLDLAPGAVETVKRRVLREQLGPKLAKELGLDIEQAEAQEALAQKSRFERRRQERAAAKTGARENVDMLDGRQDGRKARRTATEEPVESRRPWKGKRDHMQGAGAASAERRIGKGARRQPEEDAKGGLRSRGARKPRKGPQS